MANEFIARKGILALADSTVSGSLNVTGALTLPSPPGSDGRIQYNNGGALEGASTLYWDNVNNRVGIGTSTPDATLIVQSDTADSTVFAVDGVNGRLFSIDDSLSDSLFSVNTIAGLPVMEAFADNTVVLGAYNQNDFVISDSKIGIGTASPGYKLDINGDINIPFGTSNGYRINGNRVVSQGSGFFEFGALDYKSTYPNISTNSDGTFRIQSNGSTLVTVNQSGNVGIGTTSPSSLFNIYANNTSVVPLLRIENDGTGDAALSLVSTGELGWSIGLDNSDSNKLKISTDAGSVSSSTKFTLDASGNVGIGTTSPSYQIEVNNTINENLARFYRINSATSISHLVSSGRPQTRYSYDSQQAWYIGNNIGTFGIGTGYLASTTPTFNITSAGNVGIGTTSPFDSKLQVVGRIRAAGGTSGGYFFGSEEFDGGMFTPSDGNLAFSTNNVERFRIDGNGNVGIGTTTPSSRLDVNGDLNTSSGVYRIGGNTILAGTTSVTVGSSGATGIVALRTTSGDGLVLNGGNVGIGTTTPAAKLSVFAGQGDGILLQAGNSLLGNTGSGYSQLIYWGGTAMFYGRNTPAVPGGVGASVTDHIFRTGGTTRMTVNAAGNVEIDNNLTVGGTITAQEFRSEFITNTIILESGSTQFGDSADDTHTFIGDLTIEGGVSITRDSSNTQLKLKRTGTATGEFNLYTNFNKLFIQNVAQSTYPMVIDANGNVGIGTVTPSNASVYISRSNIESVLTLESSDDNAIINLRADSGGTATGYNADPRLVFNTGDVDKAFIIWDESAEKIAISGDFDATTAWITSDLSGNVAFPQYTAGVLVTDTNGNISADSLNYPTQANNDARYVNVTGDTMTGQLIMGSAGAGTFSHELKLTNSTYQAGLDYQNNGNLRFIDRSNSRVGAYVNLLNGEFAAYNTGNTITTLLSTNGNSYFNGGNVGIGTASPTQKLHVVGGNILIGSNNYDLRGRDTGGNDRTLVRINSSNEAEYGWSGAGPVKFMGGGSYTERMRIHTNGNVGIGTTSPADKLDVSGQITQIGAGNYHYATGTARFSEGGIKMSRGGSGYIGAYPLKKIDTFVASVSFRTLTSTHLGIAFRASDTAPDDNNYAVIIRNDSPTGTEVRVQKRLNTAQTYPIDAVNVTTDCDDGEWHTLNVSFNGSHIIVYIDGTKYFDEAWTDTSFTDPGLVGTMIYDGAVEFADFDVSETKVLLTELDDRYVNVTGDTMTGDLTVNNIIANANVTSANNYLILDSTDNDRAVMLLDPSDNLVIQTGTSSGSRAISFTTEASEKMRITHTGNVGIGTTSPLPYIDSGTAKGLQISNAGRAGIRFHDTGDVVRYFDIGVNADTAFISAIYSQTPTIKYQAASQHIFETNSSEVMRITSTGNSYFTGNVGIGTTSPSYRLEVQGDFYVNGTNGALTTASSQSNLYLLNLTRTTTSLITAGKIEAGGDLEFTKADGIQIKAKESMIFTIDSDNNDTSRIFQFKDGGGDTLMRIGDDGNVGIGTTSPAYKLQVKTPAVVSGSDYSWSFDLTRADSTGRGFSIGQGANGGTIAIGGHNTDMAFGHTFGTDSNGNPAFYETLRITHIDQGVGNVGIGTDSPAFKLDVVGATRINNGVGNGSGAALYVEGSGDEVHTSGGSIFFGAYDYGNSTYIRGYDNSAGLYFYANGTLTMNVAGNGRVGIGTTSPAYKLDVDGTFNSTGLFTNGINQHSATRYTGPTSQVSFNRTVADHGTTQWFKVYNGGGSTTLIRLSINSGGDNTNSRDEFLISTAGYGFYHHIQRLPGGRYNGSKLLGIATRNPSDGGSVEIWIKLEGMVSDTASTTVWANAPLDSAANILASATATIPAGSANDTELDISSTNRNESTIMASRGATFGGRVGIGTSSPDSINALEVHGQSRVYGKMMIGTSATSNGVASNVTLHVKDSAENARIRIEDSDSDNLYYDLFTNHNSGFSINEGTATRMFFQHSTGNVGIGTTSPSEKLEVDGTGKFNAIELVNGAGSTTRGLFSDGTQGEVTLISPERVTVLFDSNNNDASSFFAVKKDNTDPSNATELFRVDSSGYVGIGTDSPINILDIDGGSVSNIMLRGNQTTDTRVGGVNFYNTAGSEVIAAIASDRDGANDAGALTFDTQPAGGSMTERMRISSAGNVGIGTGAPSQKLEVIGNIKAGSGAADNYVQSIFSDGSETRMHGYGFYMSRTNSYIRPTNDGSQILAIGTDNNTWNYVALDTNYFTVSTNASEHLRVTNIGNVGIGTTSPSKKLHTLSEANEGIFMEGTGSGHWFDFKSGTSQLWSMGAQAGIMGWYNRDQSDYKMVITDAGNVGIGTTAPLSHSQNRRTLVVSDGADGANVEIWGNAGGKSILQSVGGDTYVGNLTSGNGNGTTFITSGNGSTYTTILANGNVGIGTTTPGEKLDVNGTVQATNFIETSARKFKENISPLENALETVTQLQGVSFNRIGEDKLEHGFIADEVKEVSPELVSHDANGEVHGVHYARTVALLTEAVKELNQKVNSQDLFIRDLVARIEKLESK